MLSACVSSSTTAVSSFSSETKPARLSVCSGYGCILKDRFEFTKSEERRLKAIMAQGGGSPGAERKAISAAIATMEKMARRHLRYQPDVEFSYQKNAGKRGQMDCIDESLNTTGYLKFLKRRGWLKHHTPYDRYAARGIILDGRYPHKSARMTDTTGVDWAVDSWKGRDGKPPQIMQLAKWYKDRNSSANY